MVHYLCLTELRILLGVNDTLSTSIQPQEGMEGHILRRYSKELEKMSD